MPCLGGGRGHEEGQGAAVGGAASCYFGPGAPRVVKVEWAWGWEATFNWYPK